MSAEGFFPIVSDVVYRLLISILRLQAGDNFLCQYIELFEFSSPGQSLHVFIRGFTCHVIAVHTPL